MDYVSNWNYEQLKEAFLKADIRLRPIVIYVNPQDEQTLIETLGDMIKQVIIKPCEMLERGTAYAFNREYIEKPFSFGFEEV